MPFESNSLEELKSMLGELVVSAAADPEAKKQFDEIKQEIEKRSSEEKQRKEDEEKKKPQEDCKEKEDEDDKKKSLAQEIAEAIQPSYNPEPALKSLQSDIEMMNKRFDGLQINPSIQTKENMEVKKLQEENQVINKHFNQLIASDNPINKFRSVGNVKSFTDQFADSSVDDYTIKNLEGITDFYAKRANVDQRSIDDLKHSLNVLKEIAAQPNTSTSKITLKSQYNTQIGTQGGVFSLPQMIQFGEKYFAASALLGAVNFVPTVANELNIISQATQPVPSVVYESQSVIGDNQIGEFESIKLQIRAYYQVCQKVSDLMLKSENAGVATMSFLQESSASSIARFISKEILFGSGGGDDRIVGILSSPTLDITNYSSENRVNAKPAGMRRVLLNGSSTVSATTLDRCKQLINTIPSEYLDADACYIMSPKTWDDISLLKASTGQYLFDSQTYPMHGGLDAVAREHAFSKVRVEDMPFGIAKQIAMSSGAPVMNYLFGFPVLVDPAYPDVASASTGLMFGNFRKAYTLAQTIALGIRPIVPVSVSNGVGYAGAQFAQAFQVYMQAAGKMTNSQAFTGLLMS